MPNTEFVFLSGKAKWVRHQVPNQWGNWAMTLYLDASSLEKFKKLKEEGVKNVLKKDEDGYNVSFNRPTSKLIRGKVVGFAPPEIIGNDGEPLRDQLVGNGSDVTIKLECYKYRSPQDREGRESKACRWLALRVDNLVPFQKDRDFEDDQTRAVRGLEDQPQPLF